MQERHRQQQLHRQRHFSFETPSKYGPGVFTNIWESQAASAAKVLHLLGTLLMVTVLGLFIYQAVRSVMEMISTAAIGCSYLGTWALAMQACRLLHTIGLSFSEASPAAVSSGYILDYLGFGPTPTMPSASTTSFIQSLDPRHCTALLGTLASVFGCLVKRG